MANQAPDFTQMYYDAAAAYADLIGNKITSYSIGGRTFTYQSAEGLRKEVLALRELAAIDNGMGTTTLADVRTHLGRTTEL